MTPWFEKSPERLDFELKQLGEAGYQYTLDEVSKANGQIKLAVLYPLNGGFHTLEVYFPDEYPFQPFEIFGPTLPPGRHICPISGVLCLMQDLGNSWTSYDYLANILQTKVKDIVDYHLDPENLDPTTDGVQRSGQYPYWPDSVMLTQNWTIPADIQYGRLVIGMEVPKYTAEPIRGVVLEVQDHRGNVLASVDERFKRQAGTKILGRWTRMEQPPDGRSDEAFMSDVSRTNSNTAQPKFDKGIDVFGVLFKEDSSRNAIIENWLFCFTGRLVNENGRLDKMRFLIRSDSIDQGDISARVPMLTPLAQKKVLLVGAGALGSTIATQLARAGIGEIRIVDQDIVQLGNIPRWQLGFSAVGLSKARALVDHLSANYPFTVSVGIRRKLGGTRIRSSDKPDRMLLDELLQDVDLVIDASAEKSVSVVVSRMCKERGISYLWATGTHGSRGGVVGRVTPGTMTGCWDCYKHLVNGNEIEPPAEDPQKEEVQPKGCFHPTFTGTGFDMDQVSLMATRLAVATLCRGHADAYPDLNGNLFVLSQWDDTGPIPPTWKPYPLDQHKDCKNHG